MSSEKTYGVREFVLAYIDAQRPPWPHEDFRAFRRARLAALESAFKINLSFEGLPPTAPRVLWMLFSATVQSFLRIRGPRADFLEDGLLNSTIERLDTPALKLKETEARLFLHLQEARNAHLELLDGLFVALWGVIEHPVSSSDLARLGFDDAAEPKLSDYYDKM